MNFKDLYVKGMLEQQQQKEKNDQKREFGYRGGNAGVMVAGIPANSCSRKVIARAEGRFEETSWNTQLMFDLGELNENRWHDKLRLAGITVESADDKVSATTSSGTPITGSPDSIVLTDGKESYLLEHKHLSSFWTFRDKVIEGKPSLEHLAQAGFYAMHLQDIPFCILYTASVKFSGPSFLTNLVPKPTEPGSENFEYTYYYYTGKMKTWKGKQSKEKKKLVVPGHLQGAYPSELFRSLGADFAEFKNTIPTIVQYDLRFNEEGVIEYKHPLSGKWIASVVSKKSIMDFYDYTEKMHKEKELPKRPLTLDVKGEAKGFDSCSYCTLAEVCDKYENVGYETWLREAKKVRW